MRWFLSSIRCGRRDRGLGRVAVVSPEGLSRGSEKQATARRILARTDGLD